MKFQTVTAVTLVIACTHMAVPAAGAQTAGAIQPTSAPISDIRYEVTFDSATALRRTLVVTMSFAARSAGDVLLSLPAWTPGAYSIVNFARYVSGFSVTDGSSPLSWDKLDHDTWRVRATRPSRVRVSFEYLAMTLDNSNSWTKPEFAFFNGTNIFLYPEGLPAEFQSTVTVHTSPSWRIATGMTQTGPTTFTAPNYHDLVDMPFFIGRFDIDSAQAGGKVMRVASYPAGAVSNSGRRMILDQLAKLVPPQAAIFGEVPWNTYTLMQVADSGYAPGSASGLEHQNSHLDILSHIVLGNPVLASLYSHELFHAWNVKRMRPAEMWPYRYDRPQPTPLLWISEGITDYYADVAEVRGGLINAEQFYAMTTAKIDEISEEPAIALEDASLSAWVHPVDGTGDIYYSKGSLAGFLLDILIRDASDNQRSLDTVMREVYRSSWKRGRGFTNEEWWQAVARAASRPLTDFERRYVDGREAFPWDSVLPLAGMKLMVERTVLPNLGVSISGDEQGARVIAIDPAGAGSAAGIRVGDYVVSIGGLDVRDPAFATSFSAKYAGVPPGGTVPVVIRRAGQPTTLNVAANFRTSERRRIVALTDAAAKAVRIRDGILTGKPAS
ncbi:MAG: PDZ domain-containing protein [Gemmatimonadota bacterium]|nr:PDZ domain-containing protein [Gemmatimonadota bacterium]